MSSTFRAISLSYKTAPLELREQISLNEDDCKQFLLKVRDFIEAHDVLVLSTCNRTEIYYSSEKDQSEQLIKLIGLQKGIENIIEHSSKFDVINSQSKAVLHLFRVAIGLESQVVGDLQISGQAKNAYQWSADADMAGPILHRVMHSIFFTNKRVVQETPFRDGAASVSYATAEMITDLTANIINPKVLILGLGEMGADVCRNLSNTAINEIFITNRTKEKAEELALELGFKALDFENYLEAVNECDVIVSGVRADEPIIKFEDLKDTQSVSFKYFIDMSMPRSIDERIEEKPGHQLYNIDTIQNKTTEALEKRKASVPIVEQIIKEALIDFSDWAKEMEVSPTIKKLKSALEQIRREEIDRYVKKLNLEESKHVEAITKNITQKIIKLPVLQLKAACQRGEAETLIDVLNDLFNLEMDSESVKN